jgi:uncharacterized small protein (DUF1192 family)
MFRLTPPQRHDIDPSRSEVLAYIMSNMAVDLGRAIRAFNSMRHVKSQVLVYDRIHRQWRGCDWLPAEEVDKVSMLVASVLELKRDLAVLRSEVRKVKADVAMVRRKKGRKEVAHDEGDDLEPKPEEEQQAAPKTEAAILKENLNYWNNLTESLYPEEKVSSPSTPPQSLASDSTDPTEYPWENAEDEVS